MIELKSKPAICLQTQREKPPNVFHVVRDGRPVGFIPAKPGTRIVLTVGMEQAGKDYIRDEVEKQTGIVMEVVEAPAIKQIKQHEQTILEESASDFE